MTYPVHDTALPDRVLSEHGYRVGFARTLAELQAVQRLRFEIFNLELGEGFETSFATGLDVDRFDPVCHHLIVTHEATGAIVGTYRLQTSEMAARYEGFYSADEYLLDRLPAEILGDAVEIGRACVARDYRNRHVLFLLWRGLALYLSHNGKRYLFGCCSLTSQDPVEGHRVMEHLRNTGHVHPRYLLPTRPGWECRVPSGATPGAGSDKVEIPRLFSLYLRYQAKVCSEPALDRHFKTIDYLVLFDRADLDDASRGVFFEGGQGG